jgi:hypothetical protein
MARLAPGEGIDDTASLARRLAERLCAETVAADADAVDAAFIDGMSAGLLQLSDAISEQYLINRNRLASSYRIDE